MIDELTHGEVNAIIHASQELSLRIAKKVDPAAVMAVLENEVGPYGPFLPDGRPTVVFEGHIFWRELQKLGISPIALISDEDGALVKVGNMMIDTTDILYPRWDKRYHFKPDREWEQLQRARMINLKAADMSTSWGGFQIMGFNYEYCGYHNIDDFVSAQGSKLGQLISFCWYIHNTKLTQYLVADPMPKFRSFALRYNGPDADANNYPMRMEKSWHIAMERLKQMGFKNTP